MPRYIDADKLVYQIERKIPSYTGGNDNFVRGFKDALLRVKSMVHSAKTADVQEVKRGNWEIVDKNEDIWCDSRCTVCKNIVRFYNGFTAAYKYCPNCGARMGEEGK